MSSTTVVVIWNIYLQNVPKRSNKELPMNKQQHNSQQHQQQKHYPQLKIKIMQWQEISTSILVAGNATNKKKEGMKSWILLDSESTKNIFKESKYLTNI